jgi:hypothetical protein
MRVAEGGTKIYKNIGAYRITDPGSGFTIESDEEVKLVPSDWLDSQPYLQTEAAKATPEDATKPAADTAAKK